jgi:sec-independent protein translocase protein TatB
MSFPELLVILFVALIAFGPKQLPMVVKHMARAIRLLTQLKDQAAEQWHAQAKEWQLIDNEEKAAQADKQYQSAESSGNRSTNE